MVIKMREMKGFNTDAIQLLRSKKFNKEAYILKLLNEGKSVRIHKENGEIVVLKGD
jgi:hypothetical protein